MLKKIAILGECMLELTRQPAATSDGGSLPMNLSYGGDTLNAAVYLARRGAAVEYVTALGDDPMSEWMVAQWRSEGVGCELVSHQPNAVPGLYMIETDGRGERSFYYWRDNSPARRMFDDRERAEQLFAQLMSYSWLYLSGISLAIVSEASRDRLLGFLADYRTRGGTVIFDDNYRARLWRSRDEALNAYEAMYRITDIALPTLEDEQELFGDAGRDEVVGRLQSWGVGEIALKMGASGCLVVTGESRELVPTQDVPVVDTTSAGDSFNAGYLAARVRGMPAMESARAGHSVASVVVQHRGAIIPVSEMPAT